MTALLLLAVIAWLPGALLFRMPLLSRDRRAALAAEERLFWAIVLSVASSLSIVMALAAAHRYSFRRLVIADVLVSLALAAIARGNLRFGPAARRAGPAALLPLALLALALWRLPPPSEYIIGGKDPGVYLNAGVQIAQRGTLVYHDPVVANVPAAARELFLPQDKNRDVFVAPRFMGFFILDPDTGAEVSQFPHLYPASIAVGYGLGGLTGARRVVTFWGVFGVLAVYFLGARLFGRPAALAAAILLTLHVVQLWFSRYPNADMVMQALLFASLLACARGHADDDPFFAPVAGALLGLQLFLRFDAVVAIGAAVAAVALGYVAGHRLRWTFFAPLAVAGVLCLWYLTGPMREYFELPYLFLTHLPMWEYYGLAAGALAVIVLLVAGRRVPTLSSWITQAVPWAMTVGVIALAVYALYLRQPGGKLTDYDAYSLRIFAGFYVTLPALIAALIGYAIVVRPLFWRDPAFVVVLTAFALFFFYKIRIVPEHFWAARRFVPILLPGTLLLAAAAALTGVRGRLLLTRAVRTPIGIVFLVVLATQYVRAAAPIAGHVEYEGVIAHVEALAGRIGDDDLLIVESRDAGSDVHVLGLPLANIYARNVLLLATAAPDKAAFAAFLADAHARYQRVLFLGGGGSDLLSSRWSVTPIASERFQVPEYESVWNAYPRSVNHKEFDYSLYVFGPPAAHDAPFSLDVGINDDLDVIRFHAKEKTSDGLTIRWTQRQSFLLLDHLRAGDRTLALWMSDGGRPPAAPPAVVQILAGSRPLGSITVSGGFREYDIDIPPDLAADAARSGEPVRVTLRTETWNPLRVLGTPDPRELGVMLDRVAVR
jgi:4-amino-4-deoxy-L-arabinose transferase-like glycosyltransferase